jgi:hypothetical protein
VNLLEYLIRIIRIIMRDRNSEFLPLIMSSSQQAANATANATTTAIQSGLHRIESASGPTQTSRARGYKDQSAETYDGLTSSGKVCTETTRAGLPFSDISYRTNSSLCRTRSHRRRTTFKHRRRPKLMTRSPRDNTMWKRPKPLLPHI